MDPLQQLMQGQPEQQQQSMPQLSALYGLVQTPREKRRQTVNGKDFDQALAEMYDTIQHLQNAGGGFGFNVNPNAMNNAWVEAGPLSSNVEDRRGDGTLKQRLEQTMPRLGR